MEEACRIVDPVLKRGTPVYEYEPNIATQCSVATGRSLRELTSKPASFTAAPSAPCSTQSRLQ